MIRMLLGGCLWLEVWGYFKGISGLGHNWTEKDGWLWCENCGSRNKVALL